MSETVIYARHAIIGTEPPFRTIHLQVWDNPDNPPRLLEDIRADLNKRMKAELPTEIAGHFEGFGNMLKYETEKSQAWPKEYRWVASYVVTGDSEAHYIHITTVQPGGDELIFLSKCFGGWEISCAIANLAGKMLGA